LALTVEIGDWTRLTGASIGADLGLISCEYSVV
jgi:transposase